MINGVILGYVLLKYSPNFSLPLTIIDGTNSSVKLIFDFFMYWQFIKVLKYFINMKLAVSKKKNIKFTLFNKFILYLTIFLFVLCVLQSIAVFSIFVLRIYSEDYSKEYNFFAYQDFFFYIIFPARDFLISVSFAYLYYYQGMKN